MSNELRQKQILDMLDKYGAVSVRKLCGTLFVSEATVRRDLSLLESLGALKRTHGGAVPATDTTRPTPLFIRESMDARAKNDICRRAAALVKDGDTIFIDGSSTAQYLVQYLAALKDIVVVTYSIKTAELLCEKHIKTYCTGGLLDSASLVCTGYEAIDFAKKINPDICFLSCKGLALDGRFTDTSEEETAVRRAFLQNSRVRVFLITASKLSHRFFYSVCDADEVDYIFSDGEIPESISGKLRQRKTD